MLWWSLIAVCYAASLRGESPSLVELKATTESLVYLWVEVPDQERQNIMIDMDKSVNDFMQTIKYKFNLTGDLKLVWNNQTLNQWNKLKSYYLMNSDTVKVELQ